MGHELLQAVVWDVDGTLVDSERDGHRVAFNRAFEELGLPYRWDPDLYGRLLAITGGQYRLHSYLEEQGVDQDTRDEVVPRLHRRKTELFQEMILSGAIEARPGAAETLDELEEAGVRLTVATTGTRAWVEPLLDCLFGLARFEVVVTGDEAPTRKPDPSAYHMALDAIGTSEGVVAVEDSRNGLLAARAAQLPCAVVLNDYSRHQDFSGAGVVLDGFGLPGRPATVLADPHGLAPDGRLGLPTLGALAGLAVS